MRDELAIHPGEPTSSDYTVSIPESHVGLVLRREFIGSRKQRSVLKVNSHLVIHPVTDGKVHQTTTKEWRQLGETADTGKDWTGVQGVSSPLHIFVRNKPKTRYESFYEKIPFETSERKGGR